MIGSSKTPNFEVKEKPKLVEPVEKVEVYLSVLVDVGRVVVASL